MATSGRLGKYLTWLISNKKMAMVFAFEINFWYDLRSPEFSISNAGDGRFVIKMPRCLYDISIRDISFYDEQRAKFLPWLIPGLLSEAFGSGPNEEDRNRLKNEALKQASLMAARLIQRLSSEIEKSAQQTMEMLAKSFGARSAMLDFTADTRDDGQTSAQSTEAGSADDQALLDALPDCPLECPIADKLGDSVGPGCTNYDLTHDILRTSFWCETRVGPMVVAPAWEYLNSQPNNGGQPAVHARGAHDATPEAVDEFFATRSALSYSTFWASTMRIAWSAPPSV